MQTTPARQGFGRLRRGQKIQLPQPADKITVSISWNGLRSFPGYDGTNSHWQQRWADLQACCFLLGHDYKVASTGDVIGFFDENAHAAAVNFRYWRPQAHGHRFAQEFALKLSQFSPSIERIAVVLGVFKHEVQTLAGADVEVVVADSGNNKTILTFTVPPVVSEQSAAVIVGEFYRRDGQWKFAAVGQGWEGGLELALESYGWHGLGIYRVINDKEAR